ncbi:hypothetical protein [Croceicoccus naphthovorans]|uniref:hypothetical protein n=1 Tax=Croceicoccus naphthovorans TaxID=1348774 RepID=UPI0012E06C2E|nr:hypothetical protein [Croceicoccus naphthovorans]
MAAIALAGVALMGFSRGPAEAEEPAAIRAEPVMVDGTVATGPYAPKDECAYLPGFAAFRSALMTAIDARDADQLIALSHPGIELDMDGGAGIDEFRRRLDADDTLWLELAELKELGCASDGGTDAVMPWIAARSGSDHDPDTTFWVTDNSVPLRVSGTDNAPQLAKLDRDLVEMMGGDTKGFRKIATQSGQIGYVKAADLRELGDYRLFMTRGPNGWSIDMFLADG